MEVDYRLLANLVFFFRRLLPAVLLLGWLPRRQKYQERLTALFGPRLVRLYQSGHDALIYATIIAQVSYCHCPLVVLELSRRTRYNPDLNRQIESVLASWLNQVFGLQLASEIPMVLYLLGLYALLFLVFAGIRARLASAYATTPETS